MKAWQAVQDRVGQPEPVLMSAPTDRPTRFFWVRPMSFKILPQCSGLTGTELARQISLTYKRYRELGYDYMRLWLAYAKEDLAASVYYIDVVCPRARGPWGEINLKACYPLRFRASGAWIVAINLPPSWLRDRFPELNWPRDPAARERFDAIRESSAYYAKLQDWSTAETMLSLLK